MKRKKLPVWTVRWSRARASWLLFAREEHGLVTVVVNMGQTKKQALRALPLEMLAGVGRGLQASVRIYTRAGRIQEERTYPRGADPRRSKG